MDTNEAPVVVQTDLERRMKILEMAGNDLKLAAKMEKWVQEGTKKRAPKASGDKKPDDQMDIPGFLKKPAPPEA